MTGTLSARRQAAHFHHGAYPRMTAEPAALRALPEAVAAMAAALLALTCVQWIAPGAGGAVLAMVLSLAPGCSRRPAGDGHGRDRLGLAVAARAVGQRCGVHHAWELNAKELPEANQVRAPGTRTLHRESAHWKSGSALPRGQEQRTGRTQGV